MISFQMKCLLFEVAIGWMIAVSGCRGTGKVLPYRVEAVLEPVSVKHIGSQVVAICADGDRLLLLTSSGTRVFSIDTSFSRNETIPLNIRLVPPQGLGADRYYIYLYDNKALYRMSKDKLTMQEFLANVRVAGLASYAPGEVLVSERERQLVVLKTLFGESRIFLERSDVPLPGAMADFSQGVFGVLSAQEKLVKVNRAGIVVGVIPLPSGVDIVCADNRGRAVVMKRGEARVWIGENSNLHCYDLSAVESPSGCAVMGERIFVLDGGCRLVSYRLPVDLRSRGVEMENDNDYSSGR
ncbi:MAG: hypothetical protein ACUVUD_05685 [bacterium]